MTLADAIVAKLKAIDLGAVAVDAIEAYKDVMRKTVPQGRSPVRNGDWVASLNEGYETYKSLRGFEGFADLDMGNKRYVKLFNQVSKSANSASFDYSETYRKIAEQHQTGMYDRGSVKPRELIPQNKEQLPPEVFQAVKDSIIKRFK